MRSLLIPHCRAAGAAAMHHGGCKPAPWRLQSVGFTAAGRRHAATEEPTEDAKASRMNPGNAIAIGLVFLGGGVVAINVNERRAAKQQLINEHCDAKVESLDDWRRLPSHFSAIENRLIHAEGELHAVKPWPRDEALGVEGPNQLRLRRNVEMYQWKETKHEDKDKDSKEVKVTYSYESKWAAGHLATRDDRNPKFPKFGDVTPAGGVMMRVRDNFELPFSLNFINRLVQFEDTDVTVVDHRAAPAAGLTILSGNKMLYSTGKSPGAPEIGDVRVTYSAVRPGGYSALGKVIPKQGLGPYTATLSRRLADDAKLVIPEEAHKLTRDSTAGAVPALTIPQWLSESVEKMILDKAPLEFAFVEPGKHCRSTTISHHRRHCDENTENIFHLGTALCAIGGFVAASPGSFIAGAMAPTAGLFAGVGVAYATRKGAIEQVEQMHYAPPTVDGKSGDLRI